MSTGKWKRENQSQPLEEGPASATCEHCNASAPANRVTGGPMQHYDARVPNAHQTGTYCRGPA